MIINIVNIGLNSSHVNSILHFTFSSSKICYLESSSRSLFWFCCACGLVTLRVNSQNMYEQMRYSVFLFAWEMHECLSNLLACRSSTGSSQRSMLYSQNYVLSTSLPYSEGSNFKSKYDIAQKSHLLCKFPAENAKRLNIRNAGV